ncbi:MAG: VOC family protein [Pseudomonadota bacterium]
MLDARAIATAQAPRAGTINLDHIAHFVPDIEEASAALTRLGFTLTPFSAQSHRLAPNAPLTPAGTGNRCIMLERGYLEFLTPTADTPIAQQLRAAMARYVGVQLIAFGTANPQADHARLTATGFEPLSPVALQRPINTPDGEDIARFTVVRVPPDTMPEGRIQFCAQHTAQLLWQARWLAHANAACGLIAVLICVEDPQRAAQRYSLFTGINAVKRGAAWELATARGSLLFFDPDTVSETLGAQPPALPWIAGYVLETRDIVATRDRLVGAALTITEISNADIRVPLPRALGGMLVFRERKRAAFHLT